MVNLSQIAIGDTSAQGKPVTLPIPSITADQYSRPSTITVNLPSGAGKTEVLIPMNRMTTGTVVSMVHPNGTEEIIPQSRQTSAGLVVSLSGSANLKVMDNAKAFTDVKPNDWFYTAAEFVTSRKLFSGITPTTFGPNEPMTMEMLLTVAHNYMGKPRAKGGSVTGVNAGDWFYSSANWAAENGLTKGLDLSQMGKHQAITREDTAVVLYNLSGQKDFIPKEETLLKLNAFTDLTDRTPAKLRALAWVLEKGIMSGMGDGTFGFKLNNTRAQTSAVMMNFNNKR